MMDTQRLIALIVFSFTSLILWDAWQKHSAPPVVATTTAAQAGVPAAAPSTAAAVPKATPNAAPSSIPAAAATPPAAAQPAGQPVHVRTDLVDVEIDTAGGDIRRLTLLQVSSALDRTKPLTLLEPDARHFYVSQSGLLGEGLPSHLSTYTAESTDYRLGDRATVEVRRTRRPPTAARSRSASRSIATAT